MKKVFFKGRKVRIASLFEAKNLHFGANLLEHLYSSEALMRIAFLRRKSQDKIRLKRVFPERKAKTTI